MKNTAQEPANRGPADPSPGPQRPGMPIGIPAEESGYPRPSLTPATIYQRTRAHWRIAALVTAAGLVVVAAVILIRKPVYRSETTIAYQGGIEPSLVGQEGSDALKTLAARLEELLRARSTLAPIIDELHLYPAEMERGGHVAAAKELIAHTQFKKRTADTFGISFTSSTPEQAEAVTARLADELIKTLQDEANVAADKAVEFLGSELTGARKDLEAREKALSEFLVEHPERAFDTKDPGAPEPLDDHKRAIMSLEQQLQRWTRVLKQSGDNAAPVVDPSLTAEVTAAQQNLRAKEQQRDSVLARFSAYQPHVVRQLAEVQAAEREVQAAQDRLTKAKAALDAAQSGPVITDKTRVEAQAQVTRLKTEIEKLKREPTSLPGDLLTKIRAAELEHERLKADQDAARTRVADLDRKLTAAALTKKSKTSGLGPRLVVRDPAYRPSSSETMPRSRVAMIGAVLSMLLGLAMAALRGVFLDPRIYRAADVRHLEVPVLAIVPKDTSKPDPR